ncbi:MAG TPA: matrixin family metalloprotease [Flavobacterium sp.]|nr:matrixin family metalloprotease [Flavobacterium sp.]
MKYFLILFLAAFLSCHKKETPQATVAIQPYEGFSAAKTRLVAETIDSFYQVKTVILPARKLYREAFVAVKTPRYRADSIIRIQKRSLPENIDFIIGLADKDISTTKMEGGKMMQPASRYKDWGVMGLGFCPGRSSVVSTFRLRHKNEGRHLERLKKVAVHEFGHNLGLPHCKNKKCVMADAVESIATIDKERLWLCSSCSNKIRSLD